jgi:hypothetical protein
MNYMRASKMAESRLRSPVLYSPFVPELFLDMFLDIHGSVR